MLKSLFRWLQGLLSALGLLVVLVSVTPLVPWWARCLSGPFDDPKGDVLIVLGSSAADYGTIGGSSYWRALYAVWAYRDSGFQQIIVSGGPDASGDATAGPIADFLTCQGVPRSKILLETRSTSTRENALFTAEMLRDVPGRKVLLTSDYHMYRALRAFRKAGVSIEPRPYPDVLKRSTSWIGRWPAFLDLLTETVKITYYRLHGWI